MTLEYDVQVQFLFVVNEQLGLHDSHEPLLLVRAVFKRPLYHARAKLAFGDHLKGIDLAAIRFDVLRHIGVVKATSHVLVPQLTFDAPKA